MRMDVDFVSGAAPSLFGGPARAGTPQNRSIPSAPSLFDTPLPTPPPQSSIGFNASSTPLSMLELIDSSIYFMSFK